MRWYNANALALIALSLTACSSEAEPQQAAFVPDESQLSVIEHHRKIPADEHWWNVRGPQMGWMHRHAQQMFPTVPVYRGGQVRNLKSSPMAEIANVAIETPDGPLFYRIKGNGPPLLLMHGYPQTSAMWHATAPKLAETYQVICPDLRGYGRSLKPVTDAAHMSYSKRAMADADLVVLLLDSSESLSNEDKEILSETEELSRIIAFNKIDLNNKIPIAAVDSPTIQISAKTGEGLNELENLIIEPFSTQDIDKEGFLVSAARHNDLLLRAKSELENSISLLEQKMSEEIVLIGLHNAIRYLGEITGETTTEDMLTEIFSTFCIGK